MKAYLMFRDRDFNTQDPLPTNTPDLVHDLELHTLINVMAQGDSFLFEISKTAILTSLSDIDSILYRQEVLKDCLNNTSVIREIYQVPIKSMDREHRRWLGIFTHSPSGVLSSAVSLMEMFVVLLKELRKLADEHSEEFRSEGFNRFFAMIKHELSDEYFANVEYHLKQLKFRDGVLISAELGKGNEGANYALRLPNGKNTNWLKEVLVKNHRYIPLRLVKGMTPAHGHWAI